MGAVMSLAAIAAAAEAEVASLRAQLKTVLDREAASTARQDARVAELEAALAEITALSSDPRAVERAAAALATV